MSHPPPALISGEVKYNYRRHTSFSIADVHTAALKSGATIYAVVPRRRLIGLTPGEQFERVKTMWMYNLGSSSNPFSGRLGPRRGDPRSEQEWKKIISKKDFIQRMVAYKVWEQTALAELAQVTGGWTTFFEEPAQGEGIYSRILSDINNRYTIGYQTTNKARDGKLRRVHIEVRGHPEYVVLGRKSYHAPNSDE